MPDVKKIAETAKVAFKCAVRDALGLGAKIDSVGPDYEASLLAEMEKYLKEVARLNLPAKPYTVVLLNDSYDASLHHVKAVDMREAWIHALMDEFEIPYEKAEEKLECDSDFTIAAVFDGHIEEAKV